MFTKILITWFLVGATVIMHCAGLAVILGLFLKVASANMRMLTVAWRLTSLACWMIVIHMVEITMWGIFYWWQECFQNAEMAFYFAGITYTTIGYGDLVLPAEWRMIAPIEGLTGILMCGLSAAVFFAAVSFLHKKRIEAGKD